LRAEGGGIFVTMLTNGTNLHSCSPAIILHQSSVACCSNKVKFNLTPQAHLRQHYRRILLPKALHFFLLLKLKIISK
jgi:hypothetical protein